MADLSQKQQALNQFLYLQLIKQVSYQTFLYYPTEYLCELLYALFALPAILREHWRVIHIGKICFRWLKLTIL